ncbi:hypothetical protein FA95DRAFT_1612586 [Auriscalpium vulgare]|uniref:Uncharacterized protein n=1 Tax=Auriscalpium vulgare TaxID=40419 RepID=A0ACB8R6B1_9AGAM|nr:hypothetical protein FA95DRAFT_1612586 [Auriscalpium vulgare]
MDMDEVTSKFSDDVALLELCPQVQGIRIVDNMLIHAMYPALEARLRAIRLHPLCLCPSGQPDFLALLLRTWPNLCALDLGDWVADASQPISVNGALQVLRVFNPKTSARLLSPGNDFTGLRDLELVSPFWRDAGWQHLHVSGLLPRLHTLRVIGFFPSQEVLKNLEHLESLVFTEPPQEDIVLPPTLRHVGNHDLDNSPG